MPTGTPRQFDPAKHGRHQRKRVFGSCGRGERVQTFCGERKRIPPYGTKKGYMWKEKREKQTDHLRRVFWVVKGMRKGEKASVPVPRS